MSPLDGDTAFAAAQDLATAIAARALSARELLTAQLARIERHNTTLNAVVSLSAEQAYRDADEADAAVAGGKELGSLHGVPMTLKDAHSVAGMPTTAGLRELRNHYPAADSVVVRALKAAGAIIVGKTNVPAGLLDYQCENELYGRTNNPWDLSRTPGGSSGGGASALAAGLTPLEIGSDMAGSLRLPAHFCGVYAMKPSAGLVSTIGHVSDLPQHLPGLRLATTIGPMARGLDDLELALSIIAKPGLLDATSYPVPELQALRLAFTGTFPEAPVSSEIAAAVSDLAKRLEDGGAMVVEELPEVDFREQGRTRTAMVDAMRRASMADPEGRRPGLSGWLQLLAAREAFAASWDALLVRFDAFLCPVAMVPAFRHVATGTNLAVDGVPTGYWSLGRFATPFNLVGVPALVMPLTFSRDGLPIGVQVVGARRSDKRLLAIARALEPHCVGFQIPPAYP